MPRFAANLTMLFNEVPFLDRFERAAQAGFKAVEFLFPYAFEAEELRRRLDADGLQLVLHNLPAGRLGRRRARHRLPARTGVDEFRAGVAKAHRVRQGAGRRRSSTAWPARCRPASTAAELRATFVANLRYAAAELDKAGLRLLIEPINPFDIPGFYLNRTAQAIGILDEVGADNAFVQYDIYHAQRMEGELAATMQKHLARIGHMQLADNPGRNEPGSGEINYPLPVRAPRPHRLQGLDRLRVQARRPPPRPAWAGCSALAQ